MKKPKSTNNYYSSVGGMPLSGDLMTERAVFTDAYMFMPRGVMRDIVTSYLPFWDKCRLWVLARPMSGFSETFSHYLMEVSPGGGSDRPEPDIDAEGILFVVSGSCSVRVGGKSHSLRSGSYCYLPCGIDWKFRATGKSPCIFHWFRKSYDYVDGITPPDFFVSHDSDIKPEVMANSDGLWSTTRFVDPSDLRHDMHVNIVNFESGGLIPFEETHVMEHGIYVLEGRAVYKLNRDWVEVEAGDYLWLRAFCPQACYAGGPGRFRYLLYKDVNRHALL